MNISNMALLGNAKVMDGVAHRKIFQAPQAVAALNAALAGWCSVKRCTGRPVQR